MAINKRLVEASEWPSSESPVVVLKKTMDRYLKSAALVATSNTMALAATVIGFDIVELWSGERSSCVYVHASERILEAYAVTTGLYPTDRVHVLSPRLCDQARNSPNGYYWHGIGHPSIAYPALV